MYLDAQIFAGFRVGCDNGAMLGLNINRFGTAKTWQSFWY
jgi:hypothetical protein